MMSTDNFHNGLNEWALVLSAILRILTTRASTSSVVLLRKYTLSLRIYV